MKSSGDLGERKVNRGSTGSKNNQTPEKKLIYEVTTLFLGSNVGMQPRALKMNAFSLLRLRITMRGKLDRPKLAREMHGTAHDDANVARRAIQDVYSGFNTRRAVDSALADDAAGAQDIDNDELTDGMAGLRFGEEGDVEQDDVTDDKDLNPNILNNVWEDGWAAIAATDIPFV